MRTKSWLLAACASAAFVVPAAFEQSPRAPIGVIERVAGVWKRAQDGQRLSQADLIHQGDTVLIDRARSAGTTSASVSILLLATGQLWEKTCTAGTPCEGSFRPPQPATAAGPWNFLKSYWSPNRKLDPTFVFGRGVGDLGPTHALLQRSGSAVDLRPALKRLPPGSYSVRFLPAPDFPTHSGGTERIASVRVDANAAPIDVDVPTGLYALRVTNASSEPVGSSAVVFVVDRGNVDAQATWRQAKTESQAWSGVSRTTIDAVLARALSLAAESLQR